MNLLPFVITGLTTGAVYGLAGSGLVLTYRTSGIFNFAHGATAAAAAYLFYWLTVDVGMPWQAAFALSIIGLGGGLGLLLEFGTRFLVKQTVAMQVVATVGLILVVQSLARLKFGPDPLALEPYLPGAGKGFHVWGVIVGWDQMFVFGFALVSMTLLSVLLYRSRTGLAMRAVVDSAELAGLHGTSATQMRRVAWVIGSILAAASGVLLAPSTGIDAIALTYLVVAAIGAAAIGGFSNIYMTYAGGIVIAVAADLSQNWVLSVTWLSGVPLSLPFLVLIVALVVVPRNKLLVTGGEVVRTSAPERAPRAFVIPTGAALLIVLVAVPSFAGTDLLLYMQGLALAVMFLSLGLLVRTAGQISLCHAAFAAIGAIAFSQFTIDLHMPWLLALVASAAVVIPIAALVALLAVRLNALFLALATLALGIMVENLFYRTSIGFGDAGIGRFMNRPSFAQDDRSFYYVLLGLTLAVAVVVTVVERGRLGRMLRGLAEAPAALQTMGLNIRRTKAIVFCLSAYLAALAGILYGCVVQYASYGDPYYGSFNSLILLAMLAAAPFGMPWFAVFGIVIAVIPGYLEFDNVTPWMNLLFGLFAVMVALQGGAAPAPPFVGAVFRRLRRVAPPTVSSPRDAAEHELAPVTDPGLSGHPRSPLRLGLQVEDLRVQFGGLVAVDGFSLEAPIGRITGLIGPNGAGKTTTFNACSGLTRPAAGYIRLAGKTVNELPPQDRAMLGLGRTFQLADLCDSLTVRENVEMGREASLASSSFPRQFFGGKQQRRKVTIAADEALELCGISHLAQTHAAILSTGERRLVEVARCLCGPFNVLLLDEPSAGLDRAESKRLAEVLHRIIAERDCGILLVEHDMALVMDVCQYIYVLDFGKPLFKGTPEEVATSDIVQAAYLGTVDHAMAVRAATEPAEVTS